MSSPSELADVSAQRMRWEAPLSEEHAAFLLQRLDLQPGASVLDLGCGWGELLLRAAASTEGVAAVGVDTDVASIERGRSLAAARGLSQRVKFVEADAAAWEAPADRVMSAGASHAWDEGTVAAMQALTDAVRPGGRLLFGDMCFEASPSPAAAEMFGDKALPLAELVEQARTLGWRVLHLSTADQREWDDFESTWRAGRQEWLLQHPVTSWPARYESAWTRSSGATRAPTAVSSASHTSSWRAEQLTNRTRACPVDLSRVAIDRLGARSP